MGAVYRRRTARFACGRYERTRRSHWFGLGWDGDRVGRTRQYLYAPCRGTWHRPGAPAPRRRDWFRNTRQPAAQRRCRDVAIRLWDNPPRKLSRHRDGRSRQCDHSTRSGDRAGFSVWIVLTALLIYLEKSPIQAFVNSFEIANARDKKYEEVCRVTSSDFCIRWIDSSEDVLAEPCTFSHLLRRFGQTNLRVPAHGRCPQSSAVSARKVLPHLRRRLPAVNRLSRQSIVWRVRERTYRCEIALQCRHDSAIKGAR